MLALSQLTSRTATRHVACGHLLAKPLVRCAGRRRAFTSDVIQRASDGFLDLALAIPFPEYIPPYSGTIILLTIASRVVFTVPFSIWARKRQLRTEEVVLPQLKAERPAILQQVHEEMRRDGFRGTREEAMKEHAKRAQPLIKARQKELAKQHGTSVLPTMLIPPITQLPLFVGFSMMLGRASAPPTVLDSESFLTLTSLSHGDPTGTLPVVLGIITFANVDASRWFMTAEARAREQQAAEYTAKRRAAGETVVEPRKIFQTALRVASVGRILIALLVPGSIQLYWVTSAAFGLLQTWALDWWDLRRRRARSTAQAAAEASGEMPSVVRTGKAPNKR
ncbi:hypothetical protein PsYK624_002650 [Phanerochaete sordida]|uniref:Membrane insertase YidC/Oxa/ALB C-terminal domain-containing protein n=1 Tax=Phanerochaete sordida TaxID=48140 RepID=A0A9P3L764_9APHY|nr:hypothetical protein PsYK624_002650 [Phanerochaete sordida]